MSEEENDKLPENTPKAPGKALEHAKKAGKKLWNHIPLSIKKWIYIGIAVLFAVLIGMGVINMTFALVTETFEAIIAENSGTGDTSGTGAEYSNYTDSLVKIGENGEYVYSYEKGKFSDKILKKLEDNKLDLQASGFNDKFDLDETENVIDNYAYASVKTTLPQTNIFLNSSFLGDIDGIIGVNRVEHDGTIKRLRYVKYNDFKKSIDLNTFSINPENFKIAIYTYQSSSTEYDEYDGTRASTPPNLFGASINPVPLEFDYQVRLQQYTAPLNFFVALHIMSQDNKFMKDMVELVQGDGKKTLVELTYVEQIQVRKTDYIYSGKDEKHTRIVKRIPKPDKTDEPILEPDEEAITKPEKPEIKPTPKPKPKPKPTPTIPPSPFDPTPVPVPVPISNFGNIGKGEIEKTNYILAKKRR